MKLLRIWVPDPSIPGFAAEAARQALLINAAPDAADIAGFIAAAACLSDEAYDWGHDGPPVSLKSGSSQRT
jgi:hypothetical protein